MAEENPFDKFDANPFDQFDSNKDTPKPSVTKAMLPPLVSGRLGIHGPRSERPDDPGSVLRAFEQAPYEAGAKVTDLTGSPALGYATNVSLQALPMAFGGEAVKGGVALKDIGRELMQSALKPTIKQLKSGDAATAIDTMLENGFSATKGGVAQIKAKIAELNAQIADAIASSGATISRGDVGQRLMTTLEKFSKQVNPEADMAAVRRAWEEFKNHPLLKGQSDIPVQLAQELKQGTYKQLSKKYGQMGNAEVEAQKGLARGLKEGIAEAVPEVAGLNAKESDLIKTLNVAERRALMDLNKNPIGLSWLAHNPATFAAFMADKSALFKSLAARMLYSGSDQIPAAAARGSIALSEIGQGVGRE